jgi:hypothetical protein
MVFFTVSHVHRPQQNRIAERKHRHIVETGLTLLAQSGLPPKYWVDSFLTSIFLINRLPSLVTQHASPFFKLFKKEPDYTLLRTFGCLCYLLLHPYAAHKLSFRSKPCIFLGYGVNQRGYQCLDPQSQKSIFPATLFLMSPNFQPKLLFLKVLVKSPHLQKFPLFQPVTVSPLHSTIPSPPAPTSPTPAPFFLTPTSPTSTSATPTHHPSPIANTTSPPPTLPPSPPLEPISTTGPAPPLPNNLVPSNRPVTRSQTGSLKPDPILVSPPFMPQTILSSPTPLLVFPLNLPPTAWQPPNPNGLLP